MKTENINNYYTEEDFNNFNKLKKFKNSKVNKLNNNQASSHSIRYAMSDNKHFDKIMNINNDKNSLSKKNKKTKKNNYYSSLDFDNFKKINQFTKLRENETMNKITEVVKTKTNYTANDIDSFDQIIKSKIEPKKYNNDKIISKVDNKKIKIVDFNKLKEKEKILKNKVGIEKIKIVYFD